MDTPRIGRFIENAALERWLDEFAQAGTLIAPRQVEGLVLYRQVGSSAEIAAGCPRPLMPVKELFFPPTERLFTIEKTGSTVKLEETLPQERGVIFGVRPCDALALHILDTLFIDSAPADPYYRQRRENYSLIGMACSEMLPTCFCTSVGGAPDDPAGMDVMLYPAEDGYLAQAVSERGEALLEMVGFPDTALEHTPVGTQAQFPTPAKEKWLKHFDDDYWNRITEGCLSCRACAYACPTCRCFTVRDEKLAPARFERIRCWDSCAGQNYRRLAGGHLPRAKKGERLRNRFYCKFKFLDEQVFLGGIPACTGCGRCIEVCPAGVDITEVLMDLEALA